MKRNSVSPFGGQTKPVFSTHEANKKEAFDGMRAYHRSEIDHKKDAISIFQTLITSVILIYSGIIIGVCSQINVNKIYFDFLAWIIFVAFVVCSNTITHFTNKKITQDNERYKIYMWEYICEREILNLEKDLLSINFESQWHKVKSNKTYFNWFKFDDLLYISRCFTNCSNRTQRK